MRLRMTLWATAILSLGSLGAAALAGGCGGDATTGHRVTLKTRIVADDGVDAPFTNAYGWSIQVTRLAVSVGALYWFDSASLFSSRRFFGARAALAHPGHYEPGDAMGEMLTPSSADLARGPADLAAGEGIAGTSRSGRFVFGDPPRGPAAPALGGYVVVVEGKAVKGAMVRLFRARGALADVLDASGEPRVEGCVFEGAPEITASGTVTVHVKPSVWLDQAELSEVAESAGDPVDLAPDERAFRAFARGLKKASAIVFSYSAG